MDETITKSNKSKKPKKEEKLEDIMEHLENVVARLESEKLSLEDSYVIFSEGIELVMKGNHAIDKVEKQMKILSAQDEYDLSL